MSRFPIFDIFTNQTMAWKKQIGVSDRGIPQYDAPVQVKARITIGEKMVVDFAPPGEHADIIAMVVEKLDVGDIVEFEDVSYEIHKFADTPWITGAYIGRFVWGDRIG